MLRIQGFIREGGHPHVGLEKGDDPHGTSHDMCTPGHTAAKCIPTEPPVATFHQRLNFLSPSFTFNSPKTTRRCQETGLNKLTTSSSFILPVPHTPFSVGRSMVLRDASRYLRNSHTLLWAFLVLSRRFSASCTDCITGWGAGGVAAVRSEKHLHCVFPPRMTICFQS